jgi:Ser/Thr protein kinase RdoA (MazF antagonist)
MSPEEALTAWSFAGPVRAAPIDGGLINHSWLVHADTGPVAVLQRLNTRVFSAAVHDDIEGLTAVLRDHGMQTPILLRTTADHNRLERDGEVWRAMTLVGQRTIDRLDSPAQARSAGRLVARFHAALADVDWTFHHARAGVHDSERHMRVLREAVRDLSDHRLYADVAALAAPILAAWEEWRAASLPALPRRIIHGDLKVSNLRFDGDEAVALIDLDTLAWGTLDVELGDALRSWCGTAGEDTANAVFDLDLCHAALAGYAEGAGAWGPTPEESASFLTGTRRIALELSARFAADALRESYFGWDRARFPAAGEHNLLRAAGQWSLAQAVDAALR